MKDWCPFCGKPCEVDEVDLSQYEHDVIKKFLKDFIYEIYTEQMGCDPPYEWCCGDGDCAWHQKQTILDRLADKKKQVEDEEK